MIYDNIINYMNTCRKKVCEGIITLTITNQQSCFCFPRVKMCLHTTEFIVYAIMWFIFMLYARDTVDPCMYMLNLLKRLQFTVVKQVPFI